MGDTKREVTPQEDGRPAEVREGREPEPDNDVEEDIPDRSTIESVGY